MVTTEIFNSPIQGYGFPALIEELETQGISSESLLQRASISPQTARLNPQRRLALFRAASQLSKKPGTALLAGARQRISYYGVYGYALASSATMTDAFRILGTFFDLSGSLFRVSKHVENGVGIWRSHDPESLGSVLPFVAEYWRSSQTQILSSVLGRPFPSVHMYFPYPAPMHAALYKTYLNCPVTFDSGKMEWHYDAAVDAEPCPNANVDTARLCETFCEQFFQGSGSKSAFQLEILRACLPDLPIGTNAASVARQFNMSLRTFHRRLSEEGTSFQSLVDRLRQSVAVEYLQNTELSVEEIGSRCGYNDISNFRKAFQRWTGVTPAQYRRRTTTKLATSY